MGCGASAGESEAPQPVPAQPKAQAKPKAKAKAKANPAAVQKQALKLHFKKHGLEEEADAIIEASGAKTLEDVKGWDEATLDEVCQGAGLKVIQKKKLKAALNDIKSVKVKQGNGAVDVVLLKPGAAMQAHEKLDRVFLGIGWKEKGADKVDVDLSAVSFKNNEVVDKCFWKELKNSSNSLVHTGDVLHSGQASDKKPGEDFERLYVWLSKQPEGVDTIVFVANIYSGVGDFTHLESAFIRMVNADTNQEVCRFPLSGGGLKEKMLIYTKLARVGGTGAWQLVSVGKPLEVGDCTSVDDVIPYLKSQEASAPIPAPTPDKSGGQKSAAKVQGGGAPSGGGKPVPDRPMALYACPALAVAGVAGIAAATAIFMAPQVDLGMMNPANFETDVDFGSLVPDTSALEGAGDLITGGAEDVFGWAEGVTESIDMGAIQDGVASAADIAGEGAVMGANLVGEAGGSVMEAAPGLIEDAQGLLGQAGEGLGDLAGDAGEFAEGAAGDLADAAGDLELEEMAGDAADGLGDAAGELGDFAGDAAGNIGDMAGDAGAAIAEAAGGGGMFGFFSDALGGLGGAMEALGGAAEEMMDAVGGAAEDMMGGED